MATLQTSGLKLKYDQRVVIEDLSAKIPEGKVTMIVGANACGKSTLLRGLARLLKPAAGTVTAWSGTCSVRSATTVRSP